MFSRTGSSVVLVILALLMSGGLGGCTVASMVGANSEPPPSTRDLAIVTKRGLRRLPVQLTVNEPSAVEAFSNSRIAIKPGPDEISYFPGAVWSDKLPRLLQLRLAQSLENSAVVRAAGIGNDPIRSEYVLSFEIRDFQIEVEAGTARAHVRFFVKLIEANEGVLVSSREVAAYAPAGDDGVDAGVEALQTAFSAATVKIMRWLSSRRVEVAEIR